MIKTRLRVLFGACAVLSGLALLAFVNNIVSIVRWWRGFLAAGGDSTQFAAKAPGFIPWLDWSAVDYSAVTTFIPAMGLVFLTRAAWSLLRGRRIRPEEFPFFRGSDQLNVALGLFGTLWGIIVIGYFKLDTVSMADLMQCLHTALFSTLTAVVWVFMIDRPLVRPYFLKILASTGREETDGSDLVGAVERLVTRLDEAAASFEARQKAFDAALAEQLAVFQKAQAERQTAYEAAYADRQAANAKTFADAQAGFEKTFADRLSAFEGAAAEREKAYAADFEKRLAEYRQAFEARQEEYHSFFLRRIEELQRQAGEERVRADRLASKLAAVTDALR